jgi:hypothetical protein
MKKTINEDKEFLKRTEMTSLIHQDNIQMTYRASDKINGGNFIVTVIKSFSNENIDKIKEGYKGLRKSARFLFPMNIFTIKRLIFLVFRDVEANLLKYEFFQEDVSSYFKSCIDSPILNKEMLENRETSEILNKKNN